MGTLDLKSRELLSGNRSTHGDCSVHFWHIAEHPQLHDCAQGLSQSHNKSFFAVLQRCHSWHLNWRSFVANPSFSIYEFCLISSLWGVPFSKCNLKWQMAHMHMTWMSQAFWLTHAQGSFGKASCRTGRPTSLLLGKPKPHLIHCCHLLGAGRRNGKAAHMVELSPPRATEGTRVHVVPVLISCHF